MSSVAPSREHHHEPDHPHDRARAGRRWPAPVAVGAAALAGCVAVGVLQRDDAGPTTCPFRAITGLDCPGCGMTRAVANLARAHPATAADYNLLLVLALPLVAYAYLVWLAASFGRQLPVPRLGARSAVVATALLVAFSVVRNLPIGIGRYLSSDPTR